MIQIPLEQVPNQQFEIILNNQDCLIHLYVRGDYMYLDLSVSDNPVFYGALCSDRTKIIPGRSADFSGNLIFIDTLAKHKPEYDKLNDRYLLFYLTEEELSEFDNIQIEAVR